MPLGGLRPSNKKHEEEKISWGHQPWTKEETEALHEMVREYMWARIFRRKAGWIIAWVLGVPGAILAFWEPLERLYRLFSRKLGN